MSAAVADPKADQKPAPVSETKPAEVQAVPTDAEMEEARQAFHRTQFPGAIPPPRPKKKDKPPTEEKKEESKQETEVTEKPAEEKEEKQVEKPAAAKEAPAPAPAPTVKPATKTAAESRLRDEEIDKIAERLAAKIPEVPEQKVAVIQDADVGLGLGEDEKETLEALQWMEKNVPSRKGIVAATKAFWKKESDYKAQWEKDNPGEQFSKEDKDHDAFYAKNDPGVSEREVSKAVRAMDREKVKEELRAELKGELTPEVEKLRYEQKSKELEPVIGEVIDNAVRRFVGNVDGEMGKILDENGITSESVAKLKEHDPVAFAVIGRHSERLRVLVGELIRLKELGSSYPVDGSKTVQLTVTGEEIYPHRELVQFSRALEARIAEQPEEDQRLEDGRMFKRQSDFLGAEKAIIDGKGTKPEKQARLAELHGRYWMLDPDRIHHALVAKFSDTAKFEIEKISELVEAKIATRNGHAAKELEKEKPAPAVETPRRAQSPSVSAASDRANTIKTALPERGIPAETFHSIQWPN